jgi:glycosyltransferase involved in cell wall biosynthesis
MPDKSPRKRSSVFDRAISVVLPAYNEEESIAEAVRQCLEFLPTCFAKYEVLVVDDGSADDTAEIVKGIQADHPELRLIELPNNLGYGRALAAGFAAAGGELVFFTDADGQFDVRELRDFAPLIEGRDAVFGFRVYRYDSVIRCFLSWTYNRLVRVLFLVKVRDVDCSFKLFSRRVVDALVWDSSDFFVDTEMVVRTRKLGFSAVEKGVRHYPRKAGHTTVRPSHIPQTLLTVARMWWRVNFGR